MNDLYNMLLIIENLSDTTGFHTALVVFFQLLKNRFGSNEVQKAFAVVFPDCTTRTVEKVVEKVVEKTHYELGLPAIPLEIFDIARNEGKIPAIKAYKTLYKCSLKEAKDHIEKYIKDCKPYR